MCVCVCDGTDSDLSSKMSVIIKSSASCSSSFYFVFIQPLLPLTSEMKSGKLIVESSRKRRMRRVGGGGGVGGTFYRESEPLQREGRKGGSKGRSAHRGGGSEIIGTRRSILPQLEQKLFASACLLKSVGSDASPGSLGGAFVLLLWDSLL